MFSFKKKSDFPHFSVFSVWGLVLGSFKEVLIFSLFYRVWVLGPSPPDVSTTEPQPASFPAMPASEPASKPASQASRPANQPPNCLASELASQHGPEMSNTMERDWCDTRDDAMRCDATISLWRCTAMRSAARRSAAQRGDARRDAPHALGRAGNQLEQRTSPWLDTPHLGRFCAENRHDPSKDPRPAVVSSSWSLEMCLKVPPLP